MKIPVEIEIKLDSLEKEMTEVRDKIKKSTDPTLTKKLEEELRNLTETFHDLNVEVGNFRLDEKFDDVYGEILPLNTQLGETEDRLYALAAAGKEGTAEFEALLNQAAKTKQTIRDVDEQVDLFGENRGFARVTSSIGDMNSALLSGDFVGAQRRAMGVQKAFNSITTEQVQEQMKALNGTFSIMGKVSGQMITGLMKNVGMVAKSFASFGKALLMNPIFLLAAAVVLIVTAIATLMNKLGILKPILDAIGKVFEWIGWVIDMIVEGFKMLTDWLGWTNHAAEEAAVRHTKAAEKKADAYERTGSRIIETLDEEIAIMKINGERTVEIEAKKQRIIMKTAVLRMEAIRAKIKENKLTEELDEEEVKALREKVEEQRKLYRQAASDMRIMYAQDRKDRKDALKERKEKEAESDKQAAEDSKRYAQERFKARREVIDAELNAMEDGIEKEIALNKEKYRRIVEDIRRNEAYTASEKSRLAEIARNEGLKEEAKIKEEAEIKRRNELDKELEGLLEAEKQMKKAFAERQEREEAAEQELKANRNKNNLKIQKEYLDYQMRQELEAKELTESEKKIIEDKYRQKKQELDDAAKKKEQEEEAAVLAAKKELYEQTTAALSNVTDIYFTFRRKRAEEGSKKEEQLARQQFKINKAMQLSTAIISGVQAVQSVLAAPSVVPEPLGSVLKAARAISVGAASLKNVQQIAATKFESGSGSSASTGGSGGDSTGGALTPSVSLYGTAGQFNTTSTPKPEEGNKKISVDASVDPDSITHAFKVKDFTEKNTSL